MSEKSALRLIPGKDALLEYQPIVYKAKTYVEYQGLVYKSLVDTTATFVPSEWELISDLREVRVRTITDRNALTGSTPTTGTTGIHIPILDNTNVLVLHAQADPQVGADKFARYNYNKTTNSFLLLQVSTGSTGSNVSDYNLLSNKPPIISGITAIAGAGLTGGVVSSGGVPPNRTTFTFAHADTSSQTNINATGLTYVQKLKFDTYGHVTGATTSAWIHPDTSSQASINGTGFTYIQSIGVDTDGHLTSMAQSTWVHPDTSSQGNVINTGSTVIQSITLDTDGHVTGISSAAVSSGGGGGVNFSAAGDSGGVISMPNGGILEITGGTNIQTVGTLHANRVGIRINVVAGGLNNQVQLNGSNALVGSSNLTFTGGTTLNTSNVITNTLRLNNTPSTGATSDQFITRNPVNGNLQTVGFNTIERAMVGLPINAVQFANANGLFSGSSQYIFDPTNKAITLGTRGAGTVGVNSLTIGTSNVASGASSIAIGNTNRVGLNSLAGGLGSIVKGSSSIAFGQNAVVTVNGSSAISLGSTTTADGFAAIAMGLYATAIGSGSIAIGYGGSGTFNGVTARNGGIAITNNASSPSPARLGVGASGNWSAIFGGLNHSIDLSSTGAAIVGGHRTGTGSPGLNISGTTYQDFVNISNLAIWTTPSAGGSDDILTWNATSKKINKVTQASLAAGSSPAGANGYIQFRNNSGGFGATANLVFATGTSTLVTSNLNLGSIPASGGTSNVLLTRNGTTGNVERLSIAALAGLPINAVQYRTASGFGGDAAWLFDPSLKALTLGSRTGTTGQNSIVIGTNNSASLRSLVIGSTNNVQATGGQGGNIVVGANNSIGANTSNSITVGTLNRISGTTANFAFGSGNKVSGTECMAIGDSNVANGIFAGAFGNANISNCTASYAIGNSNTIISSNNGGIALGTSNNVSGSSSVGGIGIGHFTKVVGANFAMGGGSGASAVNRITANGNGSINISTVIFGNASKNAGQGSAIFGGSGHVIDNTSADSVIVGGGANNIFGSSGGIFNSGASNITGGTQTVTIVGGAFHKITGTGGFDRYNTIVGGISNTIAGINLQTQLNIILGAQNSSISGASISHTAILGGNVNKINANVSRSVIIGGQNITLTGSSQNDHVVVPNLMIWNTPITASGSDNVLGWNSTTKKVRLGTISSTSDIRLKTDFVPLTNVVEKISSLNSYEYTHNYVIKEMEGVKSYGLTAQEVEKVFPHVVKDNYVWDNETYKTVDYRHLVPVLFAAIKELNQKIISLEEKLK